MKDYRNESSQVRMGHINMLQVARLSVSQDKLDMANLARTYMKLVRCQYCLRLCNDGYICPHCGYDGSD